MAVKVACTPKYRRRVFKRLGFGLPPINDGGTGPRIWIHALSVGEVISSVALSKAIRARFPGCTLVYSTSTMTGESVAATMLGGWADAFVVYPLDLIWPVCRVVDRIRPDIFLLIETDLWPNMLRQLSRRGKPVILINGRISEGSYRNYKLFRFFFQRVFSFITCFAMQSRKDEGKLLDMGISSERVVSIGNLKYDQARQDTGEDRGDLSEIRRICQGRNVFIAGSTHDGEEEIILSALEQLRQRQPGLLLILAPRDPNRADAIKDLASKVGFRAHKRTELKALPEATPVNAIILDTLGELSGLYGLAIAAFVGGSLVPERGHNVLEVAAHARPVLFGPHMEDFKEAAGALINGGGGFLVNNAEDLVSILDSLLANEGFADKHGQNAYRIVEQNRGAVDRAVDLISKVLGDGDRPFSRFPQ
ncbi:MAG: 3-deoxy-D-manno-octulosonic acid transferase [Pseudomonadota bacterium]